LEFLGNTNQPVRQETRTKNRKTVLFFSCVPPCEENFYGPRNQYRTKIYRFLTPDAIKFTFWGGFAVDADFTDAFSGSIEGPKIQKNGKIYRNLWKFPGGGSGPSTVLFVGPVFR
jgi:hypothetical protein